MMKKTYVRVITLLLAALMILGVMAPAFTAYAASELTVINNTTDKVEISGDPEDDISLGTLYFSFKEENGKLVLYSSTSSSSEGTSTNQYASGSTV